MFLMRMLREPTMAEELRKDVRAGRLAVTRIGRQVRVTPKSLRAFLSKQDRKRKN